MLSRPSGTESLLCFASEDWVRQESPNHPGLLSSPSHSGLKGSRRERIHCFVHQFAEHELGFGGGVIDAGFVVLLDGGEGTLHGSAVSGVSANFELAGELVQESGAGMIRMVGYG